MTIVFTFDGETLRAMNKDALRMFRAMRGALWARGDKRDPKAGDRFDGGITIVSIAV